MKKPSFFFLLFLVVCQTANAQLQLDRQVIASAGGYGENAAADLSISWTVGEVVINTLESTDGEITLTQGIQQPDPAGVTASREVALEKLGVVVFPNPVQQTLTIRLDLPPKNPLTAQLLDLSGKVLLKRPLDVGSQEMDMGSLPAAPYVLQFTDGVRVFSSVKIVKVLNP